MKTPWLVGVSGSLRVMAMASGDSNFALNFVIYTVKTIQIKNLFICSVMDARGKFGEHERCVRVARGDSRVQL